MKRLIAREFILYFSLVITFALLMHPDLLDAPSDRFSHLIERENFIHPFFYTLIIYLLLFVPRFLLSKFIKFFFKAKKSEH